MVSIRGDFRASLALTVYLLCSTMAIAAPLACDVDGSGAVDAVDVQLTVNAVLGIESEFDTNVDRDPLEKTDAVDVQLIVNAVLGISVDSDQDGLPDAAEANLGTDPQVFDSDGGGIGDGEEVLGGTDPLDPDDDGSSRAPLVTLTDRDGLEVTVNAIPGRIVLQVAPETPEADALDLIQAHGGTVLDSLPEAGLYYVEVVPGQEDLFIVAMNDEPAVVSALPDVLSDTPIPLSVLEDLGMDSSSIPQAAEKADCSQVPITVIDDFSRPTDRNPCPHGFMTESIAKDSNPDPVTRRNVFDMPNVGWLEPLLNREGMSSPSWLWGKHLGAVLEQQKANGCPAIVSISANGQATNSYAQTATNLEQFMLGLADKLNAVGGENSIMVLSMGNGIGNRGTRGIDMWRIVDKLREKYPKLFNDGRLLLV